MAAFGLEALDDRGRERVVRSVSVMAVSCAFPRLLRVAFRVVAADSRVRMGYRQEIEDAESGSGPSIYSGYNP